MTILSEVRGPVARVTISSPHKHNALTVDMWRKLRQTFNEIAERNQVHCIVLHGDGGNFAAGADISEFPRERFDMATGRRYHLEVIEPALQAIRQAPQPVIAAIEGSCVGGGLEIISVCDVRLAARGARFGAPVGKLGFPLALPELVPLLRLVGLSLASDLLLTGRLLNADEALSAGLVQRVAPVDGMAALVEQFVRDVLESSPLAARLNKSNLRMLAEQGGLYTQVQLDESFRFFDSSDYTEGLNAFLAHRKPKFHGC